MTPAGLSHPDLHAQQSSWQCQRCPSHMGSKSGLLSPRAKPPAWTPGSGNTPPSPHLHAMLESAASRERDARATIPGSNLSTGTTHKGPWCVPGCDRSRDGTLHLRRLHGGPQCAQTGGARGASPSVPPHPTIYPCNSDPSSHTPWPPPASPGRAPSPASRTTPRPPAHGPKYLLPWLSVQNLPQPPSKQTLRSQPPQQAESSTPMPPARATLPAHRATAPGPPSAAPPCPQASSLSPANFREAGPHWLPRASHTGGAQ